MQRSGNRVSAYSAWFMLFVVFGLTSCNLSNQPKLPKPPFEVPIDLSRKGVVADFDIQVTWHNIYDFEIYFAYPKEDDAEWERVQKIVGGPHEPAPVPAPVKLIIIKKQGQEEQIIYQKTLENSDTDSQVFGHVYNYFGKTIGGCNLPLGEYRFILESLAQPQEYASILTKFHIGTDPKTIFIPINFDRSKTCPQ